MKRLTLLTTALFFGLSMLWTSCGQKAGSPEEVTEKFVKHLSNGEFDKAKEYATEDTKKMLTMVSGMAASMGNDKWKEKSGEFKKIVDSEVKEDKAKVTYCCDKDGEDKSVDLKKVDGEWKVHIQKEQGGDKSKSKMGGDAEKEKKSSAPEEK